MLNSWRAYMWLPLIMALLKVSASPSQGIATQFPIQAKIAAAFTALVADYPRRGRLGLISASLADAAWLAAPGQVPRQRPVATGDEQGPSDDPPR